MDLYINFSHPNSANSPRGASLGLLKIRQNPSVQALFGEKLAPTRDTFNMELNIGRPRPAPIGVRGAAEVRRGSLGAVFLKKSDFWPFLASGVVRTGPDRP